MARSESSGLIDILRLALRPQISDDSQMMWMFGVGAAVAITATAWLWRRVRTHRDTRADLGTISGTWMNEHRLREREQDHNR